MANDQAEIQAQYRLENSNERIQRSRIGCVVALVALPLGTSLDVILYPELLMELTVLRYFFLAVILLIYFLHSSDWFREHIRVTNFFMPVVVAVSMCAMIAITDGFDGPYYAALNLLILGVSLLLPYNFRDALILVLVTLGGFSLAGLYHGLSTEEWSQVYNNYYFILATGLIACTASFFSERARFREFRLTFELDQRNRQLAELDRIKSDFFANVSHELRTPLTLILSPIEDLLNKGVGGEKVGKELVYVRDNAYRLLKLVNDLLEVMRLEEGRSNLENRPVNLSTMVTNVVAGMRHFADHQQVDLRAEAAPDVVINGDASAVEKITINLVNNAIKFTEPGGRVKISVTSTDEFGELRVEDTGSGISLEDLPHIFDRFKQADTSSTRKHQGTGLGLALVRELTELQKGQINASSELGKGTTMRVRLPLFVESQEEQGEVMEEHFKEERMDISSDRLSEIHRKAAYAFTSGYEEDIQVDDQSEAEQKPVSRENSAANKPRLVVVEDEPDVRRYLVDVLHDNFSLATAKDGEEGLQLIRETKPDIALLDLMLPKLDGLALCKIIKEDEGLEHIKVMLLTARTDEQSKMTALDHGADDFLTKPFSTVEISKRLNNLWQTSRLQENLRIKNIELVSTLDELQRTQGKLIQSEKLNALGRLAAGLLHEVNNPLNYAFGTFQLLEREEALQQDQSVKEMMADIRDGMERISQIVRDLKTFAYPETSEMKKEFKLLEAVNSALRLTAQQNRPAKVTVQIDPGLTALGSQSHIVQVLINLVENSMQAIESSQREGKIEIKAQPESKARIKVSIRDNGSGIPDEVIDKIFDPFFTTKDVGKGLGMGLSTCHTIISNHGGTLAVDSDGESFTQFYFDLEAA